MILPERGLIVVHIQKTGGSSIAAALGLRDDLPEKHRTAAELRALYGHDLWSRCFKFAVVRNPWDRLVSWWSMIESRREAFERGWPLVPFHRYVLSRASSFAEFLTRCGDDIADGDGRKSIWRNQIDYLRDADGMLLVDRIGRFERLEDDWCELSAFILGREVPLPRVNAGAHDHYSAYYSPELVDLVGRRYARDIEAFGYAFEPRAGG